MGARALARAVQAVGDRLVENFVDERRLARARDARHAGQHAERDLHVDVAGGCAGSRPGSPRSRSACAASLGHRDRALAREELPGQRVLHAFDLLRGALRDDPARRARPRPGRGRRDGRPRASSARRARPRSPCCRGRAAARAWRSAWSCRAGAGRSRARRGCTGRRPARSRSGSPGGSAAPRRPTASPRRGPSRGSRCRRSPGSAAARDLAQDQPRDVAVGLRELDLLQPLQRPPRRQRAEVLDRVSPPRAPRATPGAAARRRRPGRRAAT